MHPGAPLWQGSKTRYSGNSLLTRRSTSTSMPRPSSLAWQHIFHTLYGRT